MVFDPDAKLERVKVVSNEHPPSPPALSRWEKRRKDDAPNPNPNAGQVRGLSLPKETSGETRRRCRCAKCRRDGFLATARSLFVAITCEVAQTTGGSYLLACADAAEAALDGGPNQTAEQEDDLSSGEGRPSRASQDEEKRHLKCDNEKRTCKRCERNGEDCIRGVSKIKFRHGSSARYDSEFSRDQTWMKTATKSRGLEYIDETADWAKHYARGVQSDTGSDDDTQDEAPLSHVRASSFPSGTDHGRLSRPLQLGQMGPPSPVQVIPRSSDVFDYPSKRRRTNESMPPMAPSGSHNGDSPSSNFSLPLQSPNFSFSGLPAFDRPQSANGSSPSLDFAKLLDPVSRSDPGQHHDPVLPTDHSNRAATVDFIGRNVGASAATEAPYDLLSPRFWTLQSVWPYPSLQEACLMRYFVENLAHWFDLCDPERHFALVVPQRARSCPPLLNAIFTASARHLSRLNKYRTAQGVVNYLDNLLPDLNVETAIHYHERAITHLIQLCNNPDQVHDENLLAAASILRFYEEVDAPLREAYDADKELYLRIMNIFINAQVPVVPSLPHSSPMISFSATATATATNNTTTADQTPPSSSDATMTTPTGTGSTIHRVPSISRHNGLRQAAFWVAFRQEIYSAFMKQRPFSFPLERCDSFRTFEPAEDAVWADRLIVFCADVLQFCHGSTEHPQRQSKERWTELRAAEQRWAEALPTSFEPIYYREPDLTAGEVFPELWYLADCHVAGLQHVELARILLCVYNPSVPKLGPGQVAALNQMSSTLKTIVRRLCGIALSNRKTPPGLVTACMGIAMCGEHFSERSEQEALLSVLEEMEVEHAWPEANVGAELRKAWGW